MLGVNSWKRGRPLGYLRHGETRVFFPIWSLNQWTPFCVIVSSTERFYKTLINGEKVYETMNYTATHKNDSSNLMLLNNKGVNEQTYGAMADLNIWSRALSEEESRQWGECRVEEEGGHSCVCADNCPDNWKPVRQSDIFHFLSQNFVE